MSIFNDLSAILLTDLLVLRPSCERPPCSFYEVMCASFDTGSLKYWWLGSLVELTAYFSWVTRQLKLRSQSMISKPISFIWSVIVLAPYSFSSVPIAFWKTMARFLLNQTYRQLEAHFLLEFLRQDHILKIVWIPSDFMWFFFLRKKNIDCFDPDLCFFWSYSWCHFNSILWISIHLPRPTRRTGRRLVQRQPESRTTYSVCVWCRGADFYNEKLMFLQLRIALKNACHTGSVTVNLRANFWFQSLM